MPLISRNITSKINWCLDNLLPPVLRDARWLCRLIYFYDDGLNTDKVIGFKENLPHLSDEDIGKYYELRCGARSANRPTDLNKKSMEFILAKLHTPIPPPPHSEQEFSILDAGGGRCELARRTFEHTGSPVTVLDAQRPKKIPDGIVFVEGNLKQMPFKDKAFDVTLCTHTLEHIRNPETAISELLRVTRRQLIIVMPKQREYRYSNDLHINYCPYMYRFKEFVGIPDADYYEIDGDFVCCATLGLLEPKM